MIFSLIFHENTHCGYPLEVPCLRTSVGYTHNIHNVFMEKKTKETTASKFVLIEQCILSGSMIPVVWSGCSLFRYTNYSWVHATMSNSLDLKQ